jgi:hypothetical protein
MTGLCNGRMTGTASFDRLPTAVRNALQEIFGRAASGVELIENSWLVRWHPRAIATTRPNRIYLRGTIAEFARDPGLVLHEYFHVLNQWAPKRLTRRGYVLEWLRRGYVNNRFEIEAREFEAANQRRFRLLVARSTAEREGAAEDVQA